MRSARELHGLAVVDVQAGRRLGHIEEVVVSPDDLRLLGFVMKEGNLLSQRERIVEADGIRSIGPDAVTVEGEELAREPDAASDAFREARAGERRLVGSKVVTEEGTLLGTVEDFAIDETQQRVGALTLRGGLLSGGDALPADRIVSVGPDVVVVRAEATTKAGRPSPEETETDSEPA